MEEPSKSYSNINKGFFETLYYKKNFDIKDTILLTGSSRSGTTWLMEILRTIPGYTDSFEPLNPMYYPKSFEIGLRSRTYIPASKIWPEAEKYLNKILTSKLPIDISSLDKDVKFKDEFNIEIINFIKQMKPELIRNRLLGDKLIVKFVRLNRMLPWIAERFKLRSMILLLRHPCSVVTSQMKTGFCGYQPSRPPYKGIYPDRETIIKEASNIDLLNSDILERIKKIKSLEEIIATSWCLDTYVPLSYKKPHPWITITYEKFMKDGKNEIDRLFKNMGEPKIPKSAYKHLRIPSKLTQKDQQEIVKKSDKQLSKWKEYLSKEQIEKILSIVKTFGLDFYCENIEPDYENIKIK
jgi:hypothetical protein